MEPDYFGSFKQSQRLSIFVVHEIQLRLRYIMESDSGSLMTSLIRNENGRAKLSLLGKPLLQQIQLKFNYFKLKV